MKRFIATLLVVAGLFALSEARPAWADAPYSDAKLRWLDDTIARLSAAGIGVFQERIQRLIDEGHDANDASDPEIAQAKIDQDTACSGAMNAAQLQPRDLVNAAQIQAECLPSLRAAWQSRIDADPSNLELKRSRDLMLGRIGIAQLNRNEYAHFVQSGEICAKLRKFTLPLLQSWSITAQGASRLADLQMAKLQRTSEVRAEVAALRVADETMTYDRYISEQLAVIRKLRQKASDAVVETRRLLPIVRSESAHCRN